MRLVVVGAVAAGLSAASRARRLNPHLDIVVLEKGPDIAHAACGLPYYIEGRVSALEDLQAYSPEYFERERRITVRTDAEVAAIAHARREVQLADGERIPYDRLIIATGAVSASDAFPGSDQPHVFTLHSPADARRLKEFIRARRPRSAVVIGAGYIGLEVADALHANGIGVTLLAGDSAILGRLDATVVDAVKRRLDENAIAYRPNTLIRSIKPNEVAGVPSDLVVLATGMKPNTALAEDAGIALGSTGAIRVSDHMETNLHDIFAAGDCAEATHLITGRACWMPLGTTANKMGRVAGACAVGRRERFAGVVGTSIVRVLGLGIGLTGLSPAQARAEGFDAVATSIDAPDRPRYFRSANTTVELVADRRTGRLLGGAVLGVEGIAGRTNVIATALHAGMTVEQFEQLDLAYAPPFAPVWDPVLIAARQLRKLL